MLSRSIAALLLVFAVNLNAQDADHSTSTKTNAVGRMKIGTLDATNHYGEEMVVTGKVVQVTIRPTVNFLNLDQKFPNSPFTVVIFPRNRHAFGDLNAFRGKSIEIKGRIKNYKDSPEIILDNANQLTVIGVTNLELFLKPKIESTPINAPPVNQATNFPEIM
ncbi:MAG TPA: hypothetical protein VE344_10255 [Methylomirabilota bacterium]|nr:hypothetical protein [Methylomirabilota bacterium]